MLHVIAGAELKETLRFSAAKLFRCEQYAKSRIISKVEQIK
jgi:hypothetical protein